MGWDGAVLIYLFQFSSSDPLLAESTGSSSCCALVSRPRLILAGQTRALSTG